MFRIKTHEDDDDDDDDHDHPTACRVLALVACSSPIKSISLFRGVLLGLVSHMVDISQLSVVVCVCPFDEHAVPIYFCNSEFSLQLG